MSDQRLPTRNLRMMYRELRVFRNSAGYSNPIAVEVVYEILLFSRSFVWVTRFPGQPEADYKKRFRSEIFFFLTYNHHNGCWKKSNATSGTTIMALDI